MAQKKGKWLPFCIGAVLVFCAIGRWQQLANTQAQQLTLQGKPQISTGPFHLELAQRSCKDTDCPATATATGTATPTTNSASASTNMNLTIAAPYQGRAYIDTWNDIHLFQTFTSNISNPSNVGKYYDFIWGTQPDQVSLFRATNPNVLQSFYIPFHKDYGTFPSLDLGKNRGLSYWKQNHPDWVLYQCDGTTPSYTYDEPNVPLDFSNPEVVNWQIESYGRPASQAGYDAIAADSMDLENRFGACGHYDKNGQWVQRYTGKGGSDSQWQQDVLSWASRMQAGLHALPHPLALVPNMSFYPLSADDPLVLKIVDHIDALLDEVGFTNGGEGGYPEQAFWLKKVQLMQHMQQANKPFYLINEFSSDSISNDQLSWALGSYLMGKGHLSSVYISSYQEYGKDIRYPAYNARIGFPSGDMYSDQQVYWRQYTNAIVVANPGTQARSVNLGGSYKDIYGTSINSTTSIAAHSILILLKS